MEKSSFKNVPELKKYAKSHVVESASPFRGRPRRHGFDWNKSGTDWGIKYPLAREGLKQSPINLQQEVCKPSSKLKIEFKGYQDIPRPVQVQTGFGWLGTAVLEGELHVTMPNGDPVVFVPYIINFSSPSQHTINGNYYDVEMYILHVNKKTKQLGAVVSVLFDKKKGGASDFLDTLNIERASDPNHVIVVDEDLQTGFYKTDQPLLQRSF